MKAEGAASSLARHAEEAFESGRLEEAVRLLRALVQQPDASPADFANLGSALAALGDHRAAVEAFSHAVDAFPDVAAQRGLSYDALGETDRARRDYLVALDLDPADVDTLINLGTLELVHDDLHNAESHLAAALAMDPRAAWQYSGVLARTDRIEEAKHALMSAIALGEERAYLDLALLSADDGDDETTIENFHRAIRAGSTLGRRQLATFFLLHDRVDEALATARQGADEGDDWSYAPLAIALERNGKNEEAAKYRALAEAAGDEGYLEHGPKYRV